MFRRLVFLILALVLADVSALAQATRETLAIETAGGRLVFQVEMAVTVEEQTRGLMFRDKMAPDHGMLFPMNPPRVAQFWMKNTLIPLDMIFIAADGRVRNIAERTVPHSLETRSSDGVVAAVLEVNGGASARLGIRPGDRVLHPLFGTTP